MPVAHTIYDVSRLSGVSTATVSRAFSEPDKVKEGTRQKVYEAAKVLHYYPNAIARAMARQRTDKIAYLICKEGATILDEFYAGICDGIMKKANRSDYQLLVSTADDWQSFGATLQTKQIEGVILGGNASAELISELQSQNLAVVMVNNQLAGFDLPCVVSDESGSVDKILDHLIQRGHRHIGMVVGRFNPYIVGMRYTSFLEGIQKRGLSLRKSDIEMCDANIESAAEAALRLLSCEDRPTAILGANDMIAAAIMKVARRLDLRLPEDLAVVGFDDSSICKMLEPELTSIHINCRQMGELCVDYLKTLLEGEGDVPKLTMVPAELIVRRSS